MPVRFQVVPRREQPDLLALPWARPLEDWDHPRFIRMARGQSRHVVRFLAQDESVFALKELAEKDARHEYTTLRQLEVEGLPAVQPVALVTGREADNGDPLDAVLVTRYLDYSLPFHYLFSVEGGAAIGRRLLDAGVVLLVRLHLESFYWGDCSLSNLLFRRDAGALSAYLVDAETAERHNPLPEGLREADVDIACENVVGGLLDLHEAGRLPTDIDPFVAGERIRDRYEALWSELTGEDETNATDRHVIDRRVRRLNDLGFDVGELLVEQDPSGDRLRVRPVLVEEGHHARELQRLTGLSVQENQARRLLNDIAAFGAHLQSVEGVEHPGAVVAARWIADVYEPVIAAVPPELRDRREPPELFHELLEHRYYLSEEEGEEVSNERALASYVDEVLRTLRGERMLTDDA